MSEIRKSCFSGILKLNYHRQAKLQAADMLVADGQFQWMIKRVRELHIRRLFSGPTLCTDLPVTIWRKVLTMFPKLTSILAVVQDAPPRTQLPAFVGADSSE